MIEQAVLAEKLGYAAVSMPDHHLVNLLMMPAPLQMAVKIACLTKRLTSFVSCILNQKHFIRLSCILLLTSASKFLPVDFILSIHPTLLLNVDSIVYTLALYKDLHCIS